MSESQLTDDEWEEICDAIMSYQWSPAPAPVRAERYIRRAVERILADRLEPYLDDRPHDPANNPTCAQADEAADYQINGLQEALERVRALTDEAVALNTPPHAVNSEVLWLVEDIRAALEPDATERDAETARVTEALVPGQSQAILDAHTEQKGAGDA